MEKICIVIPVSGEITLGKFTEIPETKALSGIVQYPKLSFFVIGDKTNKRANIIEQFLGTPTENLSGICVLINDTNLTLKDWDVIWKEARARLDFFNNSVVAVETNTEGEDRFVRIKRNGKSYDFGKEMRKCSLPGFGHSLGIFMYHCDGDVINERGSFLMKYGAREKGMVTGSCEVKGTIYIISEAGIVFDDETWRQTWLLFQNKVMKKIERYAAQGVKEEDLRWAGYTS